MKRLPTGFRTGDHYDQAIYLLRYGPASSSMLRSVIRLLAVASQNLRRDNIAEALPSGFGRMTRIGQSLYLLVNVHRSYWNCIYAIRLLICALEEFV